MSSERVIVMESNTFDVIRETTAAANAHDAMRNGNEVEQLRIALDVTKKHLAEAEEQKEGFRQRLLKRNADWKTAQLKLRELLVQWIEDERLDADDAKEVAEIVGVELTREVKIEGTFTVMVTVPFGWDESRAEYDLSIEFDASGDMEIDESEWEIESVGVN